ncbi:MAG: hypothetical protein IJN29_02130 [Akkermansia sp.]|nr:hypothetical protein [Akkermansia sp.]
MKIMHISIAAVAGLSLLLSSCVAPYDGYGTFSYSTNGYSSSVAWTSASYDANGFPIYGYYYGRPVYGYTSTGAAIFTIAALTALCFVPNWGPAPWYHGHWHYPPHIHRVPAPPHHAPGHRPASRPHGGLHAPIHKNPHQVLGKPKPHHHGHHGVHPNNRPGSQGRPNIGNNRPGSQGRPNIGNNRPGPQVRPNIGNNRPGPQVRPNIGNNRPGPQVRPNISNNRPGPQVRPNIGNNRPGPQVRPNIQARPNMSSARPASPRPTHINRVSGSSRPGGMSHHSSRPSGGRPHGGGHRR